MSRTLFVYIAKRYVTLALAGLAALTVVRLVVDFGDQLGAYRDHSTAEVAQLYAYKLCVSLQELSPAALLLSAGATVSLFRRRSEWLAMQSVGASRWVMVLPIAVTATGLALALMLFDELVVTNAGTREDQLMANVFNRWGNYRLFYFPNEWFRVRQNVFQVRGDADASGVLHEVSVFTMGPSFEVSKRVDAATMRHLRGDEWALGDVVSRSFEAESSVRDTHEVLTMRFEGTDADTFRIRTGKPERMRVVDLLEQQAIRAKVGLPTQRFSLALHNRFAYPLTGVAAALLAIGLALRTSRRGHLTLALVEGLVVSLALFVFILVGKSLVLGQHLPAVVAAWAPVVGLVAASAALWVYAERVGA